MNASSDYLTPLVKEHTKSGDAVVDNQEEETVQASPERWLVVVVAFVSYFTRGIDLATFGTVNNVLAKYFNAAPWQIDWLSNAQSITMLLTSALVLLLLKKLCFKSRMLTFISLIATGLSLTCIAMLFRNGFGVAMFGQVAIAFASVIGVPLRSTITAVWFPSNEVAPALSFMIVGLELGDVGGSVITPHLVSIDDSPSTVKVRLVALFGTLAVILWTTFVIVAVFVKKQPVYPPSVAQAKALRVQGQDETISFRHELIKFKDVQVKLLRNIYFLTAWLALSTAFATNRTATMLLSSILHGKFTCYKNVNIDGGFMTMGLWIMSIIGSLLAGPLLNKTGRYKAVTVVSTCLASVFCVLGIIGVIISSLTMVYISQILMGLCTGVAMVSATELVMEVTYPIHIPYVYVLNVGGIGGLVIVQSLLARLLLDKSGPAASLAVLLVSLLLPTVLLTVQKMTFYRQQAELSAH